MNTQGLYQMIVDLWRMLKFYSAQSQIDWDAFNDNAVDFVNRYNQRKRFARDLMLSLAAELERVKDENTLEEGQA